MIEGFVTKDGTERFANNSSSQKENYKKIHDLTLSNVGVGTYLGEPDLETDNNQKNAIKKSILSGICLLYTSPSPRDS